jgi:hypothetical protein
VLGRKPAPVDSRGVSKPLAKELSSG